MTKLFKNSKAVLSVALALAVLAVSLFTGVVINTEAACASSGVISVLKFEGEGDSRYYDPVLADTETETGADWAHAIIIDSAKELSYLTRVAGNETKGKYYKVADGIAGFDMSGGDQNSHGAVDLSGTLDDNLDKITGSGKNHNPPAKNFFQGHFDGNGATVYCLWANGYEAAGLFPYAKGDATIKNVSVTMSYLNAKMHAGGIVGLYLLDTTLADIEDNGLIIENCSVTDCHIETTEQGFGGDSASGWVCAGTGAIYGGARCYSGSFDGPVLVNNCFINLDEDHFVSLAETTAAENNIHGGIGGVAVSKGAIFTNCVVIGITPYSSYNSGLTTGTAHQHTRLAERFGNIYTDAVVGSSVSMGGGMANNFQNYDGRITQLTAQQMQGAAAIENMDLDWNVWLANPNGYPELRAAHKGAVLNDNHNGTHSITCACGVYGAPSDHVFVDGVCECGAEFNCAAKKTIHWDGTIATGFSSTGSGDSAEDPIIINTAAELAYLVKNATIRDDSAGTVTVTDKYYKIADGIGAIVLQPKAYVDEIMALDSAAAVENYFSDTSKTFIEWAGCEGWEQGSFAGTFDGNGVTIYGLYGDPNSTNGNKGLFATVDAGATFRNLTIKNAYLHTTKANFNIGAIACVCSGDGYDNNGFGFVWADRCAVINSYIRNECDSWERSGIMFGYLGYSEAAYIDNCLVYGNDATYGANNSQMAVFGSAKNSMQTPYNIPEGLNPVLSGDNMYRSMVRNSIVIGATPYISATAVARVNDPDCFVNVYTDAETTNAAANVTYQENQIKKLSAIDGETIAAEAENLDWNNVWFAAEIPEFRSAHDAELTVVPYAEDNYAGHVESCSCGLASSVVKHSYTITNQGTEEATAKCDDCLFVCDHYSDGYNEEEDAGGCLEAPTIHITCDCGIDITVELDDPNPHDFEYHAEDPSANCQTNGTAAYNYCPNCEKKYAADADEYEPFENAIEDADLVLAPAACVALPQLGWDENNHWEVCETCGEIIEGSVTSHTGSWQADLVDPASGHTGACANDACGYVANEVVPHGFGDDNVCDQCGWVCDNHNFVPDEENGVLVEGDCTTDRVVATYCTICGVQGENDVTTAPGHTDGDVQIENEVPASCTVDGSHDEVIYCTVCGDETSRTNVPDAKTGHDFFEYDEDPATCSWDGTKAHVWCGSCGHYFAADHDLEDIYSEAYLEWETDLKIDRDPDAHNWTEVEASDATCDEDGNIAFKFCEYCDTVVVGEDAYVADIDYDAFYEKTEAVFDEEWEKFIAENEEPGEDATEEEWEAFYDAWYDIWQPIYYSMYEQALIDAVAEEVTITVDALGHTLKEVAEVAATTEKDGMKAHWACEDCDKLYADKDGKTEVTAEELVIAKLAKVEDTKTENTDKNTDKNTESPKTGETVATAVAAVAAIVAAGYVLVRKARKA